MVRRVGVVGNLQGIISLCIGTYCYSSVFNIMWAGGRSCLGGMGGLFDFFLLLLIMSYLNFYYHFLYLSPGS